MRTRLKMLIVKKNRVRWVKSFFFSKILEPPQNSRRQNGATKNHTDYSQILGATVTGSRGLCTPAQCVYVSRIILGGGGRGDLTYPFILIGEINCPLCCRKLKGFFGIIYINFMLKEIKTFIFGPQRVGVIGRRLTT